MMQRVFSLALRSSLPCVPGATLGTARLAPVRSYGSSSPWSPTHLPPRPKPPPEDEIEEAFIKGSGPGGQKINKTNSAVQLKHLPTGIVVKSQATRSRSQNRAIARNLLAQRLDELRNGDTSRQAVVTGVKRKKRASADKKSRRKYRKLEEESQGGNGPEARVEGGKEAGEAAIPPSLDESSGSVGSEPAEPRP